FLELRVGAERNLPVDLAAIQVDGRERAPWPPRGGEAFGVAQGWMPVGDIGQALSQRPFGSVVVQPDGSVAVLRPEEERDDGLPLEAGQGRECRHLAAAVSQQFV